MKLALLEFGWSLDPKPDVDGAWPLLLFFGLNGDINLLSPDG